jgi:putative ABC transport system permease protein
MFLYHARLYFRDLFKPSIEIFINILGLAIGFSSLMLLSLYISNEYRLQNFAYRTNLSWWIFAVSGFITLTIALLTVCWQSWKVASRNPAEALRYE